MTPVRADLQIRRELAYDLGIAVLSVAASATALSGATVVGALLLMAAVVLTGVRVRQSLAAAETRISPLAMALTPRALVLGATAVVVATGPKSASPGQLVLIGLALVLLGGSLAVEPVLRRAANLRVPLVVRLPGIGTAAAPRALAIPVVVASLAASLVAALVALTGASALWWVLAAVVVLGLALAVALQGRAVVRRSRAQRVELPKALADYAPAFVVYTSRPDVASHQVTMWLPYLQRAGLPFVIITRERVPAEALAALTDVPIIEARRISDLDALLVPSLRAAFYVNASSGNGAFVRYHHLTHVYLGHGDSDKPPSYNPTHAMYDQVFAAGPAAVRRYAAHGVRIPDDKFAVVGRPQVEDVRPAERRIADTASPVVLYAPTWRGHVEETLLYSLPTGEAIVSALLERGATVIFRPHPFSYAEPSDAAVIARVQQLLAADAARTGRAHVWGPAAEQAWSVVDCINASDAMVSDVSSVVSDYLFSGKPFAMVAVPAEPEAFVLEYPVARAAYVLRRDLSDLDVVLDQLLGADPMVEQRAAVRVDNLGDFAAAGYASAFVDAVRRVGTGAGPTAGDTADLDGADPDTERESGPVELDGEATSVPVDAPDDGPDDGSDAVKAGRTPQLLALASRYWPVVRSNVYLLAGTGLALLSLMAALADLRWLVPVLGVLALVVGGVPLLTDLRTAGRRERLLDRLGPVRSLLVLAVLTTALTPAGALGRGGSATLTVIVVVVLATTLVGEAHIARSWGRLGLEVHDFPGLELSTQERRPRSWLPLLNVALIVVSLIAAAGAPATPVWVGLALVAVLLAALAVDLAVHALRRAQQVVVGEERFGAALAAYAPRFAVYFASPVGAAYQIGMWLPYFVRIGRPFVIVTRTMPMLRAIAEITAAAGVRVPIVFRPTLRSVEELVVPSLTTAFYVNNAVRNTHFVERRELVHVWLNHGDSEKPACYNPVHAIYDLLFSAGQAGIDRYARHGVEIPLEKFRIVGRPQVEVIEPARGPVAELAAAGPLTVLYAPTWQGPFADSRVFSLPLGRQIVTALLERGVRVVFRAHPFNYRYADSRALIEGIGALLQEDRRRTGREHLWGPAAEQQLTVEECFNLSDAMISDVSAVVSDYLKSDKPFAVVAVGRTPEQLLEQAPAARASYVIREDLGDLDPALDALLGTDPSAGLRAATRRYYLGEFDDVAYAEGFLQAARNVIDGVDVRAGSSPT